MDVNRAADATFERGDEDRFQGEVWLRSGPAGSDGTNVGIVAFSPGARTRWHRHPGGQFLYGVSGRGRVRSREDGFGHRLLPGDVVFVAAGEWHFHGADAESPMTHVAVNGGGAPEWGDRVTDEEYAQGF
jgi:quercetin dioxygenase-like cupin family protein